MVSLKPFLDSNETQLLPALMDCYQRLLVVTGQCNSDLCGPSAGDLAATLRLLEQSISSQSRATEIVLAQETAERQLKAWHDRTEEYLRQKATEMKDLMVLVATTAQSVGDRDQKHNTNLKGLTERLKTIAGLEDVTRLRASLMSSVEEMSKTVEQMARDSEQTMRALEGELSKYRNRLEHSEQAALVDSLTGLANRKRLETDMNLRIRRGQQFVLLMVDLNAFKWINDTYGHLAGDQILRQFAAELKQVCHQSDLVGRWGGDEFLVLINGQMEQAESARKRIEQWAWGAYPIKVEKGAPSIKVQVTAAIGIGLWQPGMSPAELLQSADTAMYRQKARAKSV